MKHNRFSLRAILVLMLCVACFFGGWQANEWRHAKAVKIITPDPVATDVADVTPRDMGPQPLKMPPMTTP